MKNALTTSILRADRVDGIAGTDFQVDDPAPAEGRSQQFCITRWNRGGHGTRSLRVEADFDGLVSFVRGWFPSPFLDGIFRSLYQNRVSALY